MKLRLLFAAAAASAVAFAAPVRAQEASTNKSTGFYATLGAGATWTDSVNYDESYSGAYSTGETYSGNVNSTLNLGSGFAGEAGIGYDFGDIRAEVTYVYKAASMGNISASGSEAGTLFGVAYSLPYSLSFDGSGTLSTNSVLVSGYYDIPTKSKWTPYVGGGIGYTNVSYPKTTGFSTLTIGGAQSTVAVTVPSSSGGSFGYQAKVGLGYAVSNTADLFVEGVYQGSSTVTINTVDFDGLNSFGARAGVRIRFGS